MAETIPASRSPRKSPALERTAAFLPGWLALALVLTGPVQAASDPGKKSDGEPTLFRSTLKIEPTARQVSSWPRLKAEWKIPAAVLAQWETRVAEGLSADLARQLRARVQPVGEQGEGLIVPDEDLLSAFTPEERTRWWAVLASHPANRTYRWPAALRVSTLDELASVPGSAEAVRRIRAWGVADAGLIRFADLFALEPALADDEQRTAFLRGFLAADSVFAKLETDDLDAAGIERHVAYWDGIARSRDVEPILAATSRTSGLERLDVAHLLPRLVRALLYTFPPDFRALGEPPVENAAVTVSFFDPEADPRAELAGGFSAWLAAQCDPVEEPRRFGDIVVFEDPARTRWPFAMLHIADGLLFGRPPTVYGPWVLIPADEVGALNPRVGGGAVRTYRRREAGRREHADTGGTADLPLTPAGELKTLPPGPWGRLSYYEIRLSPSTQLLESMPVPESRPEWVFGGVPPAMFQEVIDGVEMPGRVRAELEALFDGVRPDRDGKITVYPSTELVFATPREFRTRLFPYLVHGIDAAAYAQSLTIATRLSPEAWFAPGSLPEPLRRSLLALVYHRGDGLALSDFGALYHATNDRAQRRDLLKLAYQSPSLVLLMERPEPAQIPELADYWRLDPQKSLGRLLLSFAHAPDVRFLDVVHLLPPLAREMMYVYMRAPSDAPTPSCYWTALNFGAERPDSRLLVRPDAPGLEHDLVLQRIRDDYRPVDSPSALGDLIVYRRRSDGEVRHVCSYVAAGVVYTKNGFGSSSPWTMMQLAEVDALYLGGGRTERLAFRPRAPAPR